MIRSRRWWLPRATGRPSLGGRPLRVAVIGGGIAGVSAATVLAERGAAVTLYEREPSLGGRAGAHTDTLEGGGTFSMERGFHAFFRQYYNLRQMLRRIDPELSFLTPLEDYPVLGPEGAQESFSGLPSKPPLNIVELTRRTPTLGLRDLLRVNGLAALEMLRFSPARTYRRFDALSASDYLDSLRFPPRARQMLFSVFSHSFFNPEGEMSAAELLMMFHFYFCGNEEGLIFDVCNQPMDRAIWRPFCDYLAGRGVTLLLSETVDRVTCDGGSYRVECSRSETFDAVILALSVPALRALVARSPDIGSANWREQIEGLETTWPFAVWRLWLDRPTLAQRAPFVGTTGVGCLDNISLYHLFQDESRDWAEKSGGAVVELHAYAVDPSRSEANVRADLLRGLHHFYPETREAQVLDQRFLWRQDCPAFRPGSWSRRPGVDTGTPGLLLAGDFVRMPFPSALMERAAASGTLAANHLLGEAGVLPETLHSIAPTGLLAPRGQRKASHETL